MKFCLWLALFIFLVSCGNQNSELTSVPEPVEEVDTLKVANETEVIPLVMIIDNSGSMQDYQERLTEAFENFIPKLSELQGRFKFYIYSTEGIFNGNTGGTNNRFEDLDVETVENDDGSFTRKLMYGLTPNLAEDIDELNPDLSQREVNKISRKLMKSIKSIGAHSGVIQNQTMCALNRVLYQNPEFSKKIDTGLFVLLSDENDQYIEQSNCLLRKEVNFIYTGDGYRVTYRHGRHALIKYLVGKEEKAVYKNIPEGFEGEKPGNCIEELEKIYAKEIPAIKSCKVRNKVQTEILTEDKYPEFFEGISNACKERVSIDGRDFKNIKKYIEATVENANVTSCDQELNAVTENIKTTDVKVNGEEFLEGDSNLIESFSDRVIENFKNSFFLNISFQGDESSCEENGSSEGNIYRELIGLLPDGLNYDICESNYSKVFKKNIKQFIEDSVKTVFKVSKKNKKKVQKVIILKEDGSKYFLKKKKYKVNKDKLGFVKSITLLDTSGIERKDKIKIVLRKS